MLAFHSLGGRHASRLDVAQLHAVLVDQRGFWDARWTQGHGGASRGLRSAALLLTAPLAARSSLAGHRRNRRAWRRRLRARGRGEIAGDEVPTGRVSASNVERQWEEIQALGSEPEQLAFQCAVLCCVQRQLGYFAALHEGTVGKFSIVNKAPPVPFVLTWEGPGGIDEIYGMSLVLDNTATLLEQMLQCVKHTQEDFRNGLPKDVAKLRAKVSLLHSFVDITETPKDFEAGTHGLWYSEDGTTTRLVYLPEVVEKVAGEKGIEQVLAVLPIEETGSLPSGQALYRFETHTNAAAVSNLPTMKTREISQDHIKQALLFQARAGMGDDALDTTSIRFAALTAGSEDPRVRAFIVPPSGIYTNAHMTLAETLGTSPTAGLDQVRRVFVLAQVWDCFVDGCGLPERRCAWYGPMPLDLVVLERLRSSKVFSELTVEQDERERAVEVLLPLVSKCLDKSQGFTLVPVLVGGLLPENVDRYTEVLAPYMDDPANLFVVSGNAGALDETVDSSRRWTKSLPTLVPRGGPLQPAVDPLDLFLTVLTKTADQQYRFSRRW